MSIKQSKGKKYLFFEEWTEISSLYESAKSSEIIPSSPINDCFNIEGISLVYLKLEKEKIKILRLFLSKFVKVKFLQISLPKNEESNFFFELLEIAANNFSHLESIDLDFTSAKSFGSDDFRRFSIGIGSFTYLRELILYFDEEWVLERAHLENLFGNIKKLDHLKILISSKKNFDDFEIVYLAELLSLMEIRRLNLIFDEVIIYETFIFFQFLNFISKITSLQILKIKIVSLAKPKKEKLLDNIKEPCFFKDLTKFYLDFRVQDEKIEDDDFLEIGQFICQSLSFSKNLNSLKLVNFTTPKLMNRLIRDFICKFEILTHFKVNFWDVYLLKGILEEHFLLQLNERLVFLEIFNEGEINNKKLERIVSLCSKKYGFLTKIKTRSLPMNLASHLNRRRALLNMTKCLNDLNSSYSKIFKRNEVILHILEKF